MFEKRRLLLVEDDRKEIENLGKLLDELRIDYDLASTVSEATDAFARKAFDFLLTDLHIETRAGFERPDGLLIIKAALENQPNMVIVATSSDPRREIWDEALAAGAQHFIRKPLSKSDEIIIAFSLARERMLLKKETSKAQKIVKPEGRWQKYSAGYPYGLVIGDREFRIARGIARTRDTACVVMGETGTGKEEVAKLVQRLRSEKEGSIPFVAVNCATITGSLAESLLFGHRRGAFTGADQSTTGYVGEADGGILFLDEIQTLDIATQQKLLRVLNDGTYHRLGETKTFQSHFQLIAASTKDLDEEVAQGRFLVDIRSRMMGLDIYLAPLRDRKHDIPALTALYLSRKGLSLADSVFDDLVVCLQSYHWTGNIRQMFKALDAWILSCEFEELPLTVENFPVFKGMLAPREQQTPPTPQATYVNSELSSDISALLERDCDFEEAVATFERRFLNKAIARHNSLGECAKAINLPRSTFDAKRRKYGLI